MLKKWPFFLIISLLVSIYGSGQELPPILHFTPDEYAADNQNWMISQANNGHIFVANNKGLLEYNGANWALYPSPNQSIIRCVKVINEKVYTGNYRNFGYWIRNDTGALKYTSLSDSLKIDLLEDEHFWNIIDHNRWILFQSLDRIIVYNTETNETNSINANHPISKTFKLENDIFFQVVDEGLYAVENGEKKLIDATPIAKGSRIIGLISINKVHTFITEEDGFFQLKDDRLVKWNSPADDILESVNLYSGLQMNNGSLLLGSIANGIYHLSENGGLLNHINQSNGLLNNTALALFEDIDENIWVGLDNGINCVNINAPLRNFVDRKGRLGTTYASAVYHNKLYLGTNQGLFYRPLHSNEEFKLIKGTTGQVWFLKVIDEQLFCGHNLGTFIVNEDAIEVLSTFQGAWDIKEVNASSNLLIQGNYDGLYTIEKKNGIWQKPKKVEGFDISSRHFEITPDKNILVNHEYKGVFELQVNDTFTRIDSYTRLKSVSKAINSSLAKFDNEIIYASQSGIYIYIEANHSFQRDEYLSSIFDNNEYFSGKLVADENDQLWVFTKNYLYSISKEKLGNSFHLDKFVLPLELRHGKEGFENISLYDNDEYIIGTSNGYLLFNPLQTTRRSYNVSIQQVLLTSYSGNQTPLSLNEKGEFEAKQNNFLFQFSIPEYEKHLLTEYQYKLEGLHDEWSHWDPSPTHTVENLKYGSYKFLVRAKVNDRISTNIAEYQFIIKRPRLLSNAAITIYSILTILVFIGVNWFYKRYYKKQRARILEKSTNELKLKDLAAQKEIIQLKNNSLNQEINSRNRELAISTMNTIRKNTTLNNIKDELKKFSDLKEVKPVIKLIDSSLNNKQDWEFFEEAFNHADKDFFKKVKSLHPQLTPNDLRLCVYLRLNLSSKEIAQLLNISPRSVEIKRYRLRKKILLERKINLNDYFMKL